MPAWDDIVFTVVSIPIALLLMVVAAVLILEMGIRGGIRDRKIVNFTGKPVSGGYPVAWGILCIAMGVLLNVIAGFMTVSLLMPLLRLR